MEKTYSSWMDGAWKSAQKEYVKETPLLGPDGTLMMPGVLSRKKQLLPEILSALS